MQESVVFRRAMQAAQHLDDEAPPWQELLQGFCEFTGSDSANFVMVDDADEVLLLERRNGDTRAERDYLAHWYAQDILTPPTRGGLTGIWLDSQQLLSPRARASNAFYNDFMCAHRMPQMGAFVIESLPTRRTVVSVQRSRTTDRLQQLTERPQLRALCAAVQQGVARRRERAVIALETLDAMAEPFGEAGFLVAPSGVVLHASPSAAAWLGRRGALSRAGGRLHHPDPALQATWSQALHQAAHGGRAATLALPAGPGQAHRLELARADAKFSLRGEPLVLVRIGRNRFADAVPAPLLRTAFGISPMEAAVLAALAAGLQPKQIAATHRVRISTVRTQIASLMLQLGCARQADLVRKACALL